MLAELPETLTRMGTRPALLRVTGRGVRTVVDCGDLADLAHGYAAALHRRGLGRGDTLAVAVRPGADSLALLLASHRLGLRVAVVDPGVGPEVLSARLAVAAPALLVADAAAQALAGWARPLGRRVQVVLPDLRTLAPLATVGPRLPGCAPRLRPTRQVTPPDRRDEDGDAVVVFTSGTTSRPRGVVHTRASLDTALSAVVDLVRPAAGLPVIGGTFFVLLPALARGAPVALPARGGRGVARQIRCMSPQVTYLTPPQVRAVLTAGGRFRGRVYSGSAPVSSSLLARVRAAGASEAWGVYALTEMFPVAAVEAEEKIAFDERGDLVGRTLPGVGADVDATGELHLRGPHRCDRYLGEEPLEHVATGDLARVLSGDRIVLGGRLKDMVLRRAKNIYPGLYEPSLHVPGVAVAVLVGVGTPDGDEVLVALVETAPGTDPRHVRRALAEPLSRMGTARPDTVVWGRVPLGGRSRKPDRAAAARVAAEALRRRRGTRWPG